MIALAAGGEFPSLTPVASWALILLLLIAVGTWAYRGIMAGHDALGRDEAKYDDRIAKPYPPQPAGDRTQR